MLRLKENLQRLNPVPFMKNVHIFRKLYILITGSKFTKPLLSP